jgi:hypothetical protein
MDRPIPTVAFACAARQKVSTLHALIDGAVDTGTQVVVDFAVAGRIGSISSTPTNPPRPGQQHHGGRRSLTYENRRKGSGARVSVRPNR